MKKVIGYFFRSIIVLGLIAITVFLGMKIAKDTKEIKIYSEDYLNEDAEARYFIDTITSNLSKIESKIEEDIGQEVELADTGTISKIEIYFVTKVNGNYRYIVDKNVDGVQRFEIENDELNNGKFMITAEDLGLKDCFFSDINKYSINKDGIVEYGK